METRQSFNFISAQRHAYVSEEDIFSNPGHKKKTVQANVRNVSMQG